MSQPLPSQPSLDLIMHTDNNTTLPFDGLPLVPSKSTLFKRDQWLVANLFSLHANEKRLYALLASVRPIGNGDRLSTRVNHVNFTQELKKYIDTDGKSFQDIFHTHILGIPFTFSDEVRRIRRVNFFELLEIPITSEIMSDYNTYMEKNPTHPCPPPGTFIDAFPSEHESNVIVSLDETQNLSKRVIRADLIMPLQTEDRERLLPYVYMIYDNLRSEHYGDQVDKFAKDTVLAEISGVRHRHHIKTARSFYVQDSAAQAAYQMQLKIAHLSRTHMFLTQSFFAVFRTLSAIISDYDINDDDSRRFAFISAMSLNRQALHDVELQFKDHNNSFLEALNRAQPLVSSNQQLADIYNKALAEFNQRYHRRDKIIELRHIEASFTGMLLVEVTTVNPITQINTVELIPIAMSLAEVAQVEATDPNPKRRGLAAAARRYHEPHNVVDPDALEPLGPYYELRSGRTLRTTDEFIQERNYVLTWAHNRVNQEPRLGPLPFDYIIRADLLARYVERTIEHSMWLQNVSEVSLELRSSVLPRLEALKSTNYETYCIDNRSIDRRYQSKDTYNAARQYNIDALVSDLTPSPEYRRTGIDPHASEHLYLRGGSTMEYESVALNSTKYSTAPVVIGIRSTTKQQFITSVPEIISTSSNSIASSNSIDTTMNSITSGDATTKRIVYDLTSDNNDDDDDEWDWEDVPMTESDIHDKPVEESIFGLPMIRKRRRKYVPMKVSGLPPLIDIGPDMKRRRAYTPSVPTWTEKDEKLLSKLVQHTHDLLANYSRGIVNLSNLIVGDPNRLELESIQVRLTSQISNQHISIRNKYKQRLLAKRIV